MKLAKILAVCFSIMLCLSACGNNGANTGHSTPIDSSNVKGAAPATYGGNDPASEQGDTNKTNIKDTGTKASNLHNEGTR
jgi:hypothetical protein